MKVILQGNWLPAAALIRIFTFSRWHHCGVVIDGQVIESRMFGGVQLTPLEDFKKRGSWRCFEVPLSDEKKAEQWLLSQTGKRYDFKGLARFAAQMRWKKDGAHYCTDLPAIAAIQGGMPLFNENVSGYAPRDFNLLPYKDIEV